MLEPIGVVRSPYSEFAGMPLQPGVEDTEAMIVLRAELAAGLRDLDGFSHVWVLSLLHRSRAAELLVVPFLDTVPRGVFATRSPRRPNPIGLSVVRLLAVEGATIRVEGLDLLDGTPVIDVKPYVPRFDSRAAERIGWFEGRDEAVAWQRADDRRSLGMAAPEECGNRRAGPSTASKLARAIRVCRDLGWAAVHVPGEGFRPCRADEPGAVVDLDRYAYSALPNSDLYGSDGRR